jgi:hypothetical protein
MWTGSTVSPISEGGIFQRATIGALPTLEAIHMEFGRCCGAAQGREAFFGQISVAE